MERISFKVVFCLISLFLFVGIVRAETFYEGEYITGEYVNKVIDGKTYYMTMQYIKDSTNNIVYCLEPFVTFEDGKVYKEYSGDFLGYNNLTSEQKRKISLIIYYGYGYGDRLDSKWYVVTQYLVWKEVDSKANIYFTKTLNGTKVNKYKNEQSEILDAVAKHDIIPSFVKDYDLLYNDSLIIEGLNKDYEIIKSDFAYGYNNSKNIVISDVLNSGVISFRKKSNYYDRNVTIYDSNNSQDVIRPGNVVNPTIEFKINVKKGNITLDIRDDDSVYTVESDFSNTCYEILNGSVVIDSVCTGKEELIYQTGDLPYGEYTIRQTSYGIGYLPDTNLYTITIDGKSDTNLILYNKLLKNDVQIVKYACKNNECEFEENALFEVYDINNELIDTLITDVNGYSYITLGYGKYNVKQISGLNEYTLSDEFSEKIVDESSTHYKELYNYYIVSQEEVKSEYVEVVPVPDTNTDNFLIKLLDVFTVIFRGIFDFFK